MPHCIDRAAQAGANGQFVESQRFPGLVYQHGQPLVRGALPQRPVARVRVDDYGRAERPRKLQRRAVVQVATDLRQVGTVDGARMQVDAEICFCDDLVHERVRHSCRDGTLAAAGERPVEVAAIRQVAGLVEEAVHVDDGHGDQGAADR